MECKCERESQARSLSLVFCQCRSSIRTYQSLTSSIPLRLQARCLRDACWLRLPVAELVPGDVVRLVCGDKVPADLRIVAADGLCVQGSQIPYGICNQDVRTLNSIFSVRLLY